MDTVLPARQARTPKHVRPSAHDERLVELCSSPRVRPPTRYGACGVAALSASSQDKTLPDMRLLHNVRAARRPRLTALRQDIAAASFASSFTSAPPRSSPRRCCLSRRSSTPSQPVQHTTIQSSRLRPTLDMPLEDDTARNSDCDSPMPIFLRVGPARHAPRRDVSHICDTHRRDSVHLAPSPTARCLSTPPRSMGSIRSANREPVATTLG
jgi:hypothetical protein